MDKRKAHSAAQDWIRMQTEAGRLPKRGERWRHYQGEVVTILAVTVREETGKVAVAYEEQDGSCWSRLLTVWNEIVHTNDDGSLKRFDRVEEGSYAGAEP